ncbi:NADH-quinone oxidoreductase subunit J [Nocardioides sp. zg-536]|uniref:NADH-quinone oxidoreductase subunit J n=1 Tax=Nocardioides faecalis TaxID=2803858 RepID=A0A938Y875_9ACTN|nr:NADH-quinone oxidoreductase subunit J [Nocardioides faecalis]MBM9460987.1 NADH-quinone oxidoreductase subunit J [Nocardioides faecalis]MBS4751978.1 NADH-quinone oxidoreductase subunit J [Nocardioides faecalis]QVI59195.1 NADH-quinone oxidoreductase subunit J [Nocardioides faecalis]
MTAFWVLAPVMVLAALGILFVRKAVHAALLLAVVMISLAVLYAVLEAPFLFAVQIIVYTGAILMLFLFVLMLVGVDASDSVVETIKGQRVLAWLVGAGFVVVLLVGLGQVTFTAAVGLDGPGGANEGGNIQALANLLFSRYVFIFEATSALLITAAVGAMVLAHRERLTPRPKQADLAAARVRSWAETGTPLGPLPAPGVYARHNAVDTPALLPDGSPAAASVSRVLAARGTMRATGLRDIEPIAASLGVDPAARPASAGKSAATGTTEAEQPAHPGSDGTVGASDGADATTGSAGQGGGEGR